MAWKLLLEVIPRFFPLLLAPVLLVSPLYLKIRKPSPWQGFSEVHSTTAHQAAFGCPTCTPSHASGR
eukprot:4266853-Amphidinium_carterae.1